MSRRFKSRSGRAHRGGIMGLIVCAVMTLWGDIDVHALAWPPAGADVVDRVVAIVDREPVTLHDLNRAMRPLKLQIEAQLSGTARARALNKTRREVLRNLINDKLVFAQARRMNLEVTPEQIDAQIARVKEGNNWTDAEFGRAVRELGFESMGEYRANAKREMLKNQAIGYRVSSRIKVDADEVQRVYETEHLGGVTEKRASHILVKLPEMASSEQVAAARQMLETLKARALSGEISFEDLARKHSDDTNAASGGDLQWFTRGTYPEELEELVFSRSKIGDVAGPVRTDFGLHLVKITGSRIKQTVDDEGRKRVMREIRRRLRAAELERLYGLWVKELRSEAYIEVKKPYQE